MAIDSLRKRASVASLGLPFLGPSVVPDSSLSAPDRQVVANSYYGILAGGGVKTIGGTSQLELITSTGGLDVQTNHTIGGVSQLELFTATGVIDVLGPKTVGGVSQLEVFAASGGIQVPTTAVIPPGGGGGGKRRGRGRPKLFRRMLSFEGLSFRVQEEPVEIEESSAGIQVEIDRFQGVVNTLDAQIQGIDREIELFRERSDLVRVKLIEEEMERAKLFTADLLLQILQLRGIKRRRLEEEELLVILMFNY